MLFVIFINRNKGGLVVGDWIGGGSWCLRVVAGTNFLGFLFLGKQDRGMGRRGMCLLVWLLSGLTILSGLAVTHLSFVTRLHSTGQLHSNPLTYVQLHGYGAEVT
jgi:hypothetical protein